MAGVGFSFLTIHSRSPVLLVSDQCIPDGIYLVLTRGYIEGFCGRKRRVLAWSEQDQSIVRESSNVLRVDVEDFENDTRYAEYTRFAVANEIDKYTLTVGGYSGQLFKLVVYSKKLDKLQIHSFNYMDNTNRR